MHPPQIYLALSDSEQLVFFRQVCRELNFACKIFKTDTPLTNASDVFLKILVADPESTKKLPPLSGQNKVHEDLLHIMVLSHDQSSEEWLHKGIDDVIRWPVSKEEIKSRFKLFNRLSALKKGIDHSFETDLLYNLINTSSASIWSVDKDLNLISTNKSYSDFCRNAYQTVPRTGEPAIDVMPGRLKNLWNENYRKAVKGEKVVFDYSEVVKDKLIYFKVFLIPIKENDKVIRIFVYRYNITSLKEYQRKLEETNALLKKAQAIGKMGFLFWNLETNQVQISDEVCKLYGLDGSETYSMPDFIAKVCHPDDLDYVNQNLKMAIRNIRDYDIEHRIVRADGQIIWVHAKAQLLFDEQGKAVTFLGTIQDITERRKAQNELAEKEENLRTILHSIGDGVIVTDAKSRIKLMNPVAEALTEWTEIEALNQPLKNILHVIDENTRKRITDPFKKVISKGDILSFGQHALLISRSGKEIPVTDSGAPIVTKSGEISGIVFVFRDQTQEREYQHKLKESEEKYRVAFRTSPDSININRIDGLYVDINEGFTQLTGYTRDDVIGKLSSEIKIWAIPEDRKKLIKGLNKKGYVQNLESVFRCKDGSLKTGLMSATLIEINGVPHTLNITRDITDRKKTETALRLRDHALNSAAVAVVITDIEGTIKWVNRAFSTLTGYAFDEVIGQNPRLLKSGKHSNEFYENLWNTILAGKTWKGEFINKRKDGTLYTEEEIITPVFDENNRIIRFIGIKTDITQRKETEKKLEIYQNQLEELVRERTQKLEQKNKELERFNKLLLAKEFRLNELREEISNLKKIDKS